jgi:hypothetical protein
MLETGETSVQDKSLLQHIERKFELSRPLARGRDFFMGQTPTRNDQGLSGDSECIRKPESEPEPDLPSWEPRAVQRIRLVWPS